MHNGARGRHDHGHGWPRWPWVGAVPCQALPLLRFFTYNIRVRKKVSKGEGEPGNEAILLHIHRIGIVHHTQCHISLPP